MFGINPQYKKIALVVILIGFAMGSQILQILLDKKRLKELLFKFIEKYLEEPKNANDSLNQMRITQVIERTESISSTEGIEIQQMFSNDKDPQRIKTKQITKSQFIRTQQPYFTDKSSNNSSRAGNSRRGSNYTSAEEEGSQSDKNNTSSIKAPSSSFSSGYKFPTKSKREKSIEDQNSDNNMGIRLQRQNSGSHPKQQQNQNSSFSTYQMVKTIQFIDSNQNEAPTINTLKQQENKNQPRMKDSQVQQRPLQQQKSQSTQRQQQIANNANKINPMEQCRNILSKQRRSNSVYQMSQGFFQTLEIIKEDEETD
ncbi:UNKNOWN [Stylonychia lemnae]|uniref:Transmembrane protein n=1 Tax=Stylonychia lemnae TaxID=5949 RepID=A0A078ASZ7_STYLE|nr:UNKNOWN [Stylonychia lemnae]|eukprot:CDW85141.1 UNKNOWN [Stylonychia lemnae]